PSGKHRLRLQPGMYQLPLHDARLELAGGREVPAGMRKGNRIMNTSGSTFRFALLMACAFMLAPALNAQEDAPQQGYVEIGVRAMGGNWASSQFNEYRDIRPGFFIQGSGINLGDLFNGKFFLECQTRNTLLKDSDYRCSAGKYGKFRVEINWTDTPHEFTNTAT